MLVRGVAAILTYQFMAKQVVPSINMPSIWTFQFSRLDIMANDEIRDSVLWGPRSASLDLNS